MIADVESPAAALGPGDELEPAAVAVPAATPPPRSAPSSPETKELDGMLAQISDLRCGSCGYGIASYVTPPACPMCRETNWQPAVRSR